MINYEDNIGKNIKEVRLERALSQEALAKLCEFSNTTLSAYENGRKIPNLVTIAKIAKNLDVSIERLYYGDEDNAFISSEPDEGKRIVNSIYYLWSVGVITYYENLVPGIAQFMFDQSSELKGMYIYINQFSSQIKRLIVALSEFKSRKETFSNPEQYLEMLLSSVATEINNEIQKNEKELAQRKKVLKELKETPNA